MPIIKPKHYFTVLQPLQGTEKHYMKPLKLIALFIQSRYCNLYWNPDFYPEWILLYLPKAT